MLELIERLQEISLTSESRVEAPPSTPSRFGTEGTDSATMETVMERHEADRPADAGDLKRQ
jgi:hypothetical protein